MAFENTLSWLDGLISLTNLQLALEILAAESDRRTPVDLGNLVASRYIEVSDNSAVLGYSAWYGIYVHENLNARHNTGEAKFLERAWGAKREEFMRILVRR